VGIKVFKTNLIVNEFIVQALGFLPVGIESNQPRSLAIFTHGYTSHKGALLTWASRLVEEGMPAIIFDLPGHYLGGFSEVPSFKYFQQHAHKIFFEAYLNLLEACGLEKVDNLVLGGHSMGALLALKALELEEFDQLESCQSRAICVGLGLLAEDKTHLFASNFYKSTLNLRSQLVSPQLDPEVLFPWIRNEKKNINVNNHKIHFITGVDDIVVGDKGSERIADILKENNNLVSLDKPTSLPHHLPEQAASFIKKYLKKEQLF
jgi:hypothetical protein